jgi:hypothetical protein
MAQPAGGLGLVLLRVELAQPRPRPDERLLRLGADRRGWRHTAPVGDPAAPSYARSAPNAPRGGNDCRGSPRRTIEPKMEDAEHSGARSGGDPTRDIRGQVCKTCTCSHRPRHRMRNTIAARGRADRADRGAPAPCRASPATGRAGSRRSPPGQGDRLVAPPPPTSRMGAGGGGRCSSSWWCST